MRRPVPPRCATRRGHTLPELVVVLAIVALAGTVALSAFGRIVERARVRMAAADLASLLAEARDAALAGPATVAALVDASDGGVTLRAGPDTIAHRRLGALHGVRVAGSRDSVTYSSLGIGRGAANARFVIARGSAAETVWVSRLGRVRIGGGE